MTQSRGTPAVRARGRALDFGDGDGPNVSRLEVPTTPEVTPLVTSTSASDGTINIDDTTGRYSDAPNSPKVTMEEFAQDGLEIEGHGVVTRGDIVMSMDPDNPEMIVVPDKNVPAADTSAVPTIADGVANVTLSEVPTSEQVMADVQATSTPAPMTSRKRKQTNALRFLPEDEALIRQMVQEAQARYAAVQDDQQPSTSGTNPAPPTLTSAASIGEGSGVVVGGR